ncbi:hypothetical protein Taro_054136 [Colocasia esculenta]|uniref:Uncharacterized protein n=1 Tax=Colocasia esculenta TaxID=4460 RepID=A0A843XPL0_COLES|nr:hypothetical protein [Colocasia esculenta]
MKASLRFRDDQKPLVRAKIPISVLGLPFLSGVSAGEARDLRLDLATAFESGPSLRLSYRPNDPWSPFTLAVKTGIGALGSPASAPFTMSAEFNLVGRGGPSFSIQVKPSFGDFCVKKTTSAAAGSLPSPFLIGEASAVADHDTDGEGSADVGDYPGAGLNGTLFGKKKPNGVSTGIRSTAGGGIRGMLSGMELSAKSVLPLRKGTTVKFRWGVKIPPELRSSFSDGLRSKDPIAVTVGRLPLLVMNKISVEHVSGETKRQEKSAPAAPVTDVTEACFTLQKQLAALQAENSTLRKVVEELRADVGGTRPEAVTPGALTARSTRPEVRERISSEASRNDAKAAEHRKNGGDSGKKGGAKAADAGGKATKEDVNEELRKALLGATGAGV